MSSDRLLRVQTSDVHHSTLNKKSALSGPAGKPSYETEISVGEWCAFKSETGSIMVARVLAFSYMSGKTWRNQEYSLLSAPVIPPKGCSKRGIGCLCTWYNIGKNGKLINIDMDIHGYYDISNYICTVPRPRTVRDSLVLTCNIAEIKKLKK